MHMLVPWRIAIAVVGLVEVTSAKPKLTYFGIAGRGELARLYAVVGGIEIEDSIDTDGYKQKTPIGYLVRRTQP